MKIDLSPIIAVVGDSMSFESTIEPCDLADSRGEYTVTKPADVSGTVTNIGGAYELSMEGSGEIVVRCARCTKDITVYPEFSLTETLSPSIDNEDNVVFTGNSVDITNLVLSAFLSSIEYRYVCDEDCKGLCPKCGKNLNEGSCDCSFVETDPRFDILKDFFKNSQDDKH